MKDVLVLGIESSCDETAVAVVKNGREILSLYHIWDDNTNAWVEKDKWECVSDPSKTARELLTRAYGDEPYPIW